MMGTSSSTRLKSYEEFIQFLSLEHLPNYMRHHRDIPADVLNKVSIVHLDDPDRKFYNEIFHQMKQVNNYEPEYLAIDNKETSRCVGSLLGLGICDALGAST